MRLTNRLVLNTGLNKISLSHEDFSVGNSKTPIAVLPAGTQLLEASIEVKTPFTSGYFQNQISEDSPIKPFLLLGSKDDSIKYLLYDKTDVIGVSSNHNNSGSYFDNPTQFSINNDIILEAWISPNIWTISGDLNNARYGLDAAGSQSAGLSFGGYISGGTGATSYTEEYNGSSWSSGGALSSVFYYGSGCGLQTSALKNGGASNSNCEEYNGTSWSGGGASSITFREHAAFGTQTAAINCGGHDINNTNKSESYNGSSWTVENDLNVGREWGWGAGVQSAGITGNGRQFDDGSNTHYSTELYNGSVWLLSANTNLVSKGRGVGSSNLITKTYLTTYNEEFDGISWRISNGTNVIKSYHCAAGTQSCGWAAGGFPGGYDSETTENCDSADMSESSMNGHLILNLTVI